MRRPIPINLQNPQFPKYPASSLYTAARPPEARKGTRENPTTQPNPTLHSPHTNAYPFFQSRKPGKEEIQKNPQVALMGKNKIHRNRRISEAFRGIKASFPHAARFARK